MSEARLSIIVPVLNEADGIAGALEVLQHFRCRGAELIVVDGGSTDATCELARPLCDALLSAPRGRGAQINVGVLASHGAALLLLHADTRLPPEADLLIASALAERPWGRFDVSITGHSALLGTVAALMNLRSRVTGIATGDQAIFVRRAAFLDVGGVRDLALMEDIDLSSRLRRVGKPANLAQKVVTSGRRWESHGIIRTILLMWRLRFAFWLGADPARLARDYGYQPKQR